MNYKFLYKTIALICYTVISATQTPAAETGGVYGVVVDSQNNPVSGVIVSNGKKKMITRDDGFYHLSDLAHGDHVLTFQKNAITRQDKIHIKSNDVEHAILGFGEGKKIVFRNELGLKNEIVPNIGINIYASNTQKGNKLAIEVFADDTKGFDIWILNANGRKDSVTISTQEDDGNPRWSPDGTRIIYQTSKNESNFKIWVKDFANNKNEHIDDGLTPAWSLDGHSIVYSKKNDAKTYNIYKKDLDTGKTTRLTTCHCKEQYPFWGRINGEEKIVYASKSTGIYEIWIMDTDGSNKKQLTSLAAELKNRMVGPVISPDGKKIAFWEIDYKNDHSVWLMDSDGSGLKRLIRHAANPEWAGQGSNVLYFNSKITGSSQIWKTRLNKN